MDCEYHFALTQRAKQDVRQNVGYIRNELGNEKAAGMLMNELDKCIERLCIFPHFLNIPISKSNTSSDNNNLTIKQ